MIKIMGLTDKALQYLYKHSSFTKYDGSIEPIGCGYSDGFMRTIATMYELKKLDDDNVIALFEYKLINGTVKEVIQDIINGRVYLCLKIHNNKKFKWDIREGKKDE